MAISSQAEPISLRHVFSKRTGDTICVRGVLVACESNTDSFGPIISVKRYDIVKSSNEEILHWISSMLSSEAEVENSAT